MFTNIWFSRKVFILFLLSLAVSFIRKKLIMLSCKVATIGGTRKLIGLLLLSLMVSSVGWHVEARRWSLGAKPISYAAPAPKAGASATSPVREAIASKLQTQAKVKVELFVMSQCPFGVRAEEALAPVLNEFGERVDFQLRFIAKPTGDGFTSLHGQPEVDEDMRQAVMAAQFPQQYFDYVVARASDYRNTEWQPAAIAAGMEVAAVEGFARSEAGRRLFAENIRRANELRITASPTILLDGEKYTGKILPAIAAATAYGKTSAAVAPSAMNGTEAMPCTQASDCNDNNACTIDVCDPTVGCVNTQLICDDSNACTRDTCDPAQGCVYTPISCNDGDPNSKSNRYRECNSDSDRNCYRNSNGDCDCDCDWNSNSSANDESKHVVPTWIQLHGCSDLV